METRPLTVLSYGAGQDSDAILELLHRDEVFRAKYAPGRLLVVHADTGDEHPQTYTHIEERKTWCAERGIEFVHIQPAMGFHRPTWQTLFGQYEASSTVGSKRYQKTCSINLKQVPIYDYLEAFLAREYQIDGSRKEGFHIYKMRHGRLRIIMGISADEAKRRAKGFLARTKKGKFAVPEVWKRETLEAVYPLVEMGWDRKACQDYLKASDRVVPLPSNCMRCPFLSDIELVWLHRFYPEKYEEWVRVEARKIEADQTKRGMTDPKKMLGVWGERRLPEVLAEALKKYGSWTDDQLRDYKMSHGHCNTQSW